MAHRASASRRALTPVARAAVRYGPTRVWRERAWSRARHAGLHEPSRRFNSRTRFGFTIAGDQALIMPRCLHWFGQWEPLLTTWLRATLQPGDAFLDVGANTGYYTMLASRAVGPSGSVVALEPSATVRSALEANLRRNRMTNVRVLRIAGADREGTAPLYRAPWNDAETSTLPRHGHQREAEVPTAPVLRLPSEDELARMRVAKIDVEGGERAVLDGIRSDIERAPALQHVAIEVHPAELAGQESSAHQLIAGFEPLGFGPSWLPVDFSEAAHLERPSAVVPRLDDVPNDQLVHMILSR
ncbi:MAG TPA: FkbM family methyltransferase [Thermoleophilaceae bacterium]